MVYPLSRRALLRGAGAALALPLLDAMVPLRQVLAAQAAVKPPLRMVIFTVTGGTVLESWKPAQEGALTKLPSILKPLEFAKDDILVLSGLSHRGSNQGLNGHECCASLHLTGAPQVGRFGGKRTAALSVDQAAAATVGDATSLPSLEIGMTNQETTYSYRAADQVVPYEVDPRLIFERMFRGRKPIVPNWQRRQTQTAAKVEQTARPSSSEQEVVDLVLEEAKRLRSRLGNQDRNKLDQYLDGVQAVERRLARAEFYRQLELADERQPGPSKLALPSNIPAPGKHWDLVRGAAHDPDRHAEYIRLVSDLLVLALQTDTTRVVTAAIGDDGAMFPGVVTVGYEQHCHTLEHQGNSFPIETGDPIAREACRQIHQWYTELFAELVRKLKSVDEGGSTLLDNSMVLYTSYMAHGGHGTQDYPVLLAGQAGGTLKPGRHIAYGQDTPMSNLFVEMLNRMGRPTEEFGESRTAETARYDGRLPGLV